MHFIHNAQLGNDYINKLLFEEIFNLLNFQFITFMKLKISSKRSLTVYNLSIGLEK